MRDTLTIRNEAAVRKSTVFEGVVCLKNGIKIQVGREWLVVF